MIVSTSKSTEFGPKKFRVIVPDDASENMWQYGVLVGPPDLGMLNLPEEIEVRLNNELFNRGLITKQDLRKRGAEVIAALQAALKIDAQRIVELYT